jgi:glycosyltransferase involved in cell wall biosynthesis
MGRVLVEAMAAGRPVVASRVGGIPDLVRHGETGLLVTPRDDEAIAASISLLLSNPRKAERMGAQGRLKCHEFGLPAMIAGLDELYRNMGVMRVSVPAKPILPGQARPVTPRSNPETEGPCLPSG